VLATDRAAYGLRSGQLQFIGDVLRELACNCVCAECGKALVAKKGSVRRLVLGRLYRPTLID